VLTTLGANIPLADGCRQPGFLESLLKSQSR
jgi:hypothetical protein